MQGGMANVQRMHLHAKHARFASRLVIDQLFTAVTHTIMTTCKVIFGNLESYVIWRRPRQLQVKHVLLSTARQAQLVSRALILLLCKYCWATKLAKYCQPKVVSMPCTAEQQTGQFFSRCKCLSKHALQNLLCMHGSS